MAGKLYHNEVVELQELRKDKSAYLARIRELEVKNRSLKIEVNCLRAKVDAYKMTDDEIVTETIRRLREGL
tara:strand:+ start:331 stop:543 length:213 start_codon:yes stop_codon:yes gene_type:complete